MAKKPMNGGLHHEWAGDLHSPSLVMNGVY